MKICYLAAEMAPLVKTGGLADVAGALPQVLQLLGHDVRAFLPGYAQINRCDLMGMSIPVELIEDECFQRENLYGYDDDGKRFELFCRAVLAQLIDSAWQPDLLWCNDWHTGLIPLLVKESSFPAICSIKTLFTIHNLAYQGGWNGINFMEAGIVNADMVTTVSPTYAREIQDDEFACGLGEQLRCRKVIGILNGIDTIVYNPASDSNLLANYSLDDLSGKKFNRSWLQRECGFPENDEVLLLGMVSRLTEQKGFDLLCRSLPDILKMPLQLVILGSGDSIYEDFLQEIAGRYFQQMCVFCRFDEKLARRIYAGSDAFLMPSRFEPCGLGQLLALRYGSVPLVHAIGGLKDTIDDEVNGFVFAEYTESALKNGLKRLLRAFEGRNHWSELTERALLSDFSWQHSAYLYERNVFEKLKTKNS